jgi:hypothetical protein
LSNEVPSRKDIIQEAKRQRLNVRGLLMDVEHWNDSVREEGEERIEIDADGMLARLSENLNAMLEKEFAAIRFFWVTERTEIYAAFSFEQLRQWLDDSGSLYSDLGPENKGFEWDELAPEQINAGVLQEDDGEVVSFREALKRGAYPPCAIATQFA